MQLSAVYAPSEISWPEILQLGLWHTRPCQRVCVFTVDGQKDRQDDGEEINCNVTSNCVNLKEKLPRCRACQLLVHNGIVSSTANATLEQKA